jgi:hypothetical protein
VIDERREDSALTPIRRKAASVSTHPRVLHAWQKADFTARLHMWLAYKDMRHAYEEVEAKETAVRSKTGAAAPRLLTEVTKKTP